MAQVALARTGKVMLLKLSGVLRYTAAGGVATAALRDFVQRLFAPEQPFGEPPAGGVLIDLSELEAIDSTNLGLLAKLARNTQRATGAKTSILSTRAEISELLEGLGFDQFFLLLHDPLHLEANFTQIDAAAPAERELARVMLDAHRTLAAMNEQNAATFHDVIALLRTAAGEGSGPESDRG